MSAYQPYQNPYQQGQGQYQQAPPSQNYAKGMGANSPQPTWGANGTMSYTPGGTNPTMQQILALLQQQQPPADLTQYYTQMGNQYAGAMTMQQQYAQQMQAYANQLNALLGQDVGQQEHEQLMAMNQPVRHPSEALYMYGY